MMEVNPDTGKKGGDTFEKLDNNTFGWMHVKTILVAGIGFFCDAYDLFAINIVVPMIGYAYYGGITHMPALDQTLLKGAAVIGTFIGQLVFGYLGDKLGRKSVYGLSLLLMVIGAVGSAMSCSAVRGMNVVAMLTFWRFVLGIGIGGDYPLSAVITSEYATVNTRGRMMALVFSMQGVGQISAAIVSIVLLKIFQGAIEADPLNVDFVWRLVLGLGAVPAVAGAYFRAKLPETPRFTAQVKGDAGQAKRDIEAVMANTYEKNDSEIAPTSLVTSSDVQTPMVAITRPQPATFSDFRSHYAKWHNLKVLLGCALSWFMLDVAFYGLGLNQSFVLTSIGYTASTSEPYQYLYSVASGNAIINIMGAIPGYYFSVYFIEVMGRKKIQIMGFVMLTIIFLILSVGFQAIQKEALALFIALYCLGQFFFNFGPNTTTFVVPGEVFPTRFRSTSHGISAATGKLGAIVSSYGFTYISVNPPSGENGTQLLLGIFSAFMFAGIFTSFLIPETKGIRLEDLSEDD